MSDLSKTCSRLGDGAAPIVLGASLATLDGCWLELCCCGRTRLLPLRLIAEQRGGRHRLADVLARMRCAACHQPPARAWLNETPNRDASHGPPSGWSVQLSPALAGSMAEAAE